MYEKDVEEMYVIDVPFMGIREDSRMDGWKEGIYVEGAGTIKQREDWSCMFVKMRERSQYIGLS